MKLIIDRSMWLRGEGSDKSKLLRGCDGKMCCLGFYAKALGYKDQDIFEEAEPEDTIDRSSAEPQSKWPEWAVKVEPDKEYLEDPEAYEEPEPEVCQTNIIGSLMAYNDDHGLEESSREYHVGSIFRRHGVEVEFVDGGGT